MNALTRLLRQVPAECWALLLITLPLAYLVLLRIDVINLFPAHLRGPNDPDPWLRLTLVRDWLSGGSWFDHTVGRTNAPMGGIASPWTRPLDLVIAGLVKLQPDNASLSIKLLRAAAVLPLVWMTVMMLGLFHAGRQLYSHTATPIMIAALTATTPVIWAYFGRGNADHHAFLAALWAWVIALSLLEKPRARDSWIQGLLLALMLWISPEALLLIAMIYFWFGFRWLREGGDLGPLARITRAAALGTLLALLIERAPGAWFTPIYDSLSIVHVLLMALCALAVTAMAYLRTDTLRARVMASVTAGLAIAGSMLALYPKFFHGPLVDASPFIFTDFLPRINEAKPLFSKPVLFVAALTFRPFLALLGYACMQYADRPCIARRHGQYLFYLMAATLLCVSIQLRWYYYLFPVSIIMLAPMLAGLFEPGPCWPSRLLLGQSTGRQVAIRLTLVVLMLLIPLALISALPDTTPDSAKRITACERAGRAAIHSGAVARALGDRPVILYAPTNLGAEILFYTPYRIIASNYHREGEGIRYVWTALKITDASELRHYFATRQVTAALVCPDARADKNSILVRWRDGAKTPPWVTRLKLGGSDAPLLVRIKP